MRGDEEREGARGRERRREGGTDEWDLNALYSTKNTLKGCGPEVQVLLIRVSIVLSLSLSVYLEQTSGVHVR